MLKISRIIYDVCKKAGIPYKSPYYEDIRKADAEILSEIYLQLKIYSGRLKEIEERHSIKGLSQIIDKVLDEFHITENELVIIAKQIIEEKNGK